MRMWMLDPALLCRKHLLAEHNEIHKFRPTFVKHHSILGRLLPIVQIAPAQMQARHDVLVVEMLQRGYQHHSPYAQPDLAYLPAWQRDAMVDESYNYADLYTRCADCRARMVQQIEK